MKKNEKITKIKQFIIKQEAARVDNWETEYFSSENSPNTVVPVYITGHGIFQYTLHNVWGKVALIRLCILILFLNKKPKRLENSQLELTHLKIAHAHNRHFPNLFKISC